jgi:hypothetical protein
MNLRMRFSKNERDVAVARIVESGADRDRTDDPQLAKLVLSQLSYSPGMIAVHSRPSRKWWAWVDSNHRPYAYQAYALTT